MTDRSKFPVEYQDLLNMDKVLEKTPNKHELKVTLQKDLVKGVGLYATKLIKKGEVIAYYRIKTFIWLKYKSPTNFVYGFEIYTKTGKESKKLIGDIDLTSIPDPENNIPYWGLFVNEPFKDQKLNAEIDLDLNNNYNATNKCVADRYLRYKLTAIRNIEPGQEITLNYGEDYPRSY